MSEVKLRCAKCGREIYEWECDVEAHAEFPDEVECDECAELEHEAVGMLLRGEVELV